ncbi:neural cell adhesion molecule 1-like [Haemaphysalis longicornis]
MDSYTTFLDVEAPPAWKYVPGNVDVVQGQTLTLSCRATGSPSPKIGWLFKQVPPKIIAFHFRKTIKPGENARTTCLVEAGDSPMTFSWLRNGVDASLTKNVHVNTQADFSILNVSPVLAGSAGNFTCIVKNKAGFDSFTAYLDVEVPPRIQPFHFRKTAKPGETIRTSCLVEAGDRPMTFSWLRNGHDASSLPNVKINSHSEVSLLTISPVSAASAGNFTCIVKNKAGFDSFTSLLEVEGNCGKHFQSSRNRIWKLGVW